MAASLTLVVIGAAPAAAQDGTWVGGSPSAADSDYSTPTNWTPTGSPTGTATFGASANTNISISNTATVGGWIFDPAASAYTYTVNGGGGELDFHGAGIAVNGGSVSITNNSITQFRNSSTAGTASITNNFGLYFYDSSSAGSASITNSNSLVFVNSSTAGSATIANSGIILFGDNSSAGGAAITNTDPAALTTFEFGSGLNNDRKVSAGSIAGSGTFNLGRNELTVGGNNLSTAVDGVIVDGSVAGGSLVKVGSGTMTLAGANTYTGGTTISAGVVQATNNSSVGTGAVTMDGGTFQADGFSDLTFTNNFKVHTTGGAIDNNGTVLTLSGIIANGNGGTGVLQLTDSTGGFGTTVLSGVNTYTGGTYVNGANLQVTNNSSVGTGTVTLENGLFQADGVHNLTITNNFKLNNTAFGSAIDSNGTTLTIAGNISDGNGAGRLTVADNTFSGSIVTLLGTNTYTGGTLICSCATMQLGDATHTASVLGEVAVEGRFDIVNANTTGITKIVNDGLLGQATTTFRNATTASTMQIVNQNFGITEFRDTSTAGSASFINDNAGLVQFRDASSAGNAVFVNTNGGGVIFGNILAGPGGSDTSTAGNAVFDNYSASVVFLAHSDAGHATINNHGNGGSAQFAEFSSAASATIVTDLGGQVGFYDYSTAANAKFDNSGTLYFGGFNLTDSPTAANATIINRAGGGMEFDASATAGNATIINQSGSQSIFGWLATAGNATITTEDGATLKFFDNSTGGNAQFITNDTGYVDFSGSLGTNGDGRITAGSIAGSGFYFIGAGNTLVTGSNNLSTTVSGVIADFNPCGCGPAGPGSLEKVGSGTLTLSGVNTYTGGTTISAGTLQVTNNDSVSTGAVTLNGGTFQADGFSNLSFINDFQVNIAGGAVDNNGTVLTLSGTIANGNGGTGVLQLTDSSGGFGTTVLSGINTYTGGTTVRGTTLQVTNNASVGTGTVTLDNALFQADGFSDLTFTNDFKINTAGGAIDNRGTALTVSGVISNGNGSTGALTLIDTSGGFGITVLSGVNTYSGGTLVNGAAVQVTNNSSVGTGTVTLDSALFQADGLSNLTFANNFRINNSTFGSAIDANGTVLTIAGNITDGNGPGRLTVLDLSFSGRGVVLLQGTNTYSGGTFIGCCGTLQLGDAVHTASIVGDVINQGRFDIVNANTSGISSIISDFGLTTFFNTSTAGTMTIVNQNGGATAFLDASSAGSAGITNSGGVTLFGVPGGTDTSTAANATIVNDNGGTSFSAMSNAGTANITNRDNGGTLFGDQASAASATIINNSGGFTSFGQPFGSDAPTAGNALIVNNSGGETDFNAFATAGNAAILTNSGGATLFFDNSSGGNAQFVTNGTGFVDFSGSLGPNGDGRITAGSIAGSGFYYIGAGNMLVVGGNNLSTTVSGVIADFDPAPPCGCPGIPGPGSLEKAGSGTMILSGVNTYTGTTAVNGGILQVDGSIASSSLTTVNAGGALTGIGTVGNATIADGGIFLPGSGAPGTSITVSGNLAFQSGALYLVQLNSTTSSFASVTGSAALNGLVGVSFAPGSNVTTQYAILTAGSHTGAFTGVSTPALAGGLVATLSYDPTHAYLNFALDFGARSNLNVNQRNVGNTLTNFFNANGGISLTYAALTPAGLSQASGETATGSQQATFDAMNQFLGLLTDPFIAGRSGGLGGSAGATPFADEGSASAYAANQQGAARSAFARFATKADVARNDVFDPRWSVWGSAYGGGSTTNGNAALGSNSATARVFGFAAGADYQLSPATIVGFALAGGGTNFSVSGFGTGRSDLFQAGGFVRHNVGPAYVTAAAAYGWQDVTTDRTVTVAGVDRLRAEFNANAYSGRVEGGYRFATRWLGITPYAAGQFTTFSLPAYAEQVLSGGGAFALNYAAKDVTASRSELGVRTDKSFAVPSGILTLRSRFAWAHDFNTDRNVTALFQALPGASFVVNGAAQAHDSALTTGSAEIKWQSGISLAATFEGQFSNVTNSYAGKGTARYSW